MPSLPTFISKNEEVRFYPGRGFKHSPPASSMSASLIGRLGSSAFRVYKTAGPCRPPARASLRKRHQGHSIMGFEDEAERSLPSDERQVQADIRTHLIRRPARDIFPPLGGARVSSYRI